MKSYATGLLLAALVTAPPLVAAQAADPEVWGVYARLAGTRATSNKPKLSYEWRWDEDRQAIVEDQGYLGSDRLVPLSGGKIARFVKGRHLFTGTVQKDGSVVWVPEGNGLLLRMAGNPYRVRIDDDKIVYENVREKNGAVEPTSLVVRLDDPQLIGAGTSAVAATVASPKQATASAPTRAATPPVAPATPASFGWLDARVGRSFAGNRGDQVGQTLEVYREGDRLVLRLGLLAGGDLGRIVLRPGSAPGSLELLETWHTGSSNRVAYFVGSPSAPANDPLDGYYSDPRVPGALVLEYDVPGGYITLTFKPSVTATSIVYFQNGGKRTLGRRRAIGDLDYVASGWFDVTSKELVQRVIAHSDSEQLRLQEERQVEADSRADDEAYRMEHAAAAEQTRAAAAQSLADSTARLNGTVASVQAQYRSQQQASEAAAANAQRRRDVDNARGATRRQEDEAAAYAAKQRTAEQQRASTSQAAALTVATARAAVASPTATKTEAKQVFGFCSGLKPGGYDGASAIIYVSEVGPVNYAFGQPITPMQNAYAAKTGAGSVDCMVSLDRSMLERKRKEAVDNPGYPNAKRVMTGALE
ncbi:hypothetical protein [Lysobacter sp. HA35]